MKISLPVESPVDCLLPSVSLRGIAAHCAILVHKGNLRVLCTCSIWTELWSQQRIFSVWQTPTAYNFLLLEVSAYKRSYTESFWGSEMTSALPIKFGCIHMCRCGTAHKTGAKLAISWFQAMKLACFALHTPTCNLQFLVIGTTAYDLIEKQPRSNCNHTANVHQSCHVGSFIIEVLTLCIQAMLVSNTTQHEDTPTNLGVAHKYAPHYSTGNITTHRSHNLAVIRWCHQGRIQRASSTANDDFSKAASYIVICSGAAVDVAHFLRPGAEWQRKSLRQWCMMAMHSWRRWMRETRRCVVSPVHTIMYHVPSMHPWPRAGALHVLVRGLRDVPAS